MFYIDIDIAALVGLEGSVKAAADKAVLVAGQSLATATHAHILEQVQKKLHSTREKYIENLSFKQVNKDTWLISLDAGAMFIEDGMPEHEMIDALLSHGRPTGKPSGVAKGEIHTAKDGSRFRVIPFEHKKGPTAQTAKATSLTDMIKKATKQLGIPYGSVEKDAAGKPKLGTLHSFDIMKQPSGGNRQQVGNPNVPVGKHSGISLLQGVRISQHMVEDPKTGKSSVKRSISTFRIVSSKHKGSGRWHHPGLEPRHFFPEAYTWAVSQYQNKIVPEIIKQFTL